MNLMSVGIVFAFWVVIFCGIPENLEFHMSNFKYNPNDLTEWNRVRGRSVHHDDCPCMDHNKTLEKEKNECPFDRRAREMIQVETDTKYENSCANPILTHEINREFTNKKMCMLGYNNLDQEYSMRTIDQVHSVTYVPKHFPVVKNETIIYLTVKEFEEDIHPLPTFANKSFTKYGGISTLGLSIKESHSFFKRLGCKSRPTRVMVYREFHEVQNVHIRRSGETISGDSILDKDYLEYLIDDDFVCNPNQITEENILQWREFNKDWAFFTPNKNSYGGYIEFVWKFHDCMEDETYQSHEEVQSQMEHVVNTWRNTGEYPQDDCGTFFQSMTELISITINGGDKNIIIPKERQRTFFDHPLLIRSEYIPQVALLDQYLKKHPNEKIQRCKDTMKIVAPILTQEIVKQRESEYESLELLKDNNPECLINSCIVINCDISLDECKFCMFNNGNFSPGHKQNIMSYKNCLGDQCFLIRSPTDTTCMLVSPKGNSLFVEDFPYSWAVSSKWCTHNAMIILDDPIAYLCYVDVEEIQYLGSSKPTEDLTDMLNIDIGCVCPPLHDKCKKPPKFPPGHLEYCYEPH